VVSKGADPREFKESIAEVFSRAADSYDRVGPPFFNYFAEGLVRFVEIPVGAHVLDVATGAGAALCAAARATGADGRVVGVDISSEMVARAGSRAVKEGHPHVEAYTMDAENLEFSDGEFEVVLCAMGVMFFPNLVTVIDRFAKVLRTGGKLGISTFGGQDEMSRRIVELAGEYGVKKHLMWSPLRSEGEHRALLESSGFQDIFTTTEKADFIYRDPDEWWTMHWSGGLRGILECIEEGQRPQFRRDAIDSLGEYAQKDGVHHPRNVLYTKAVWLGT
jgi:ubiquinone/menaquinone biosynthesis C-methylase UbiE